MKHIAFAAAALVLLAAGSAAAQDLPPGPALPGVCIYSHEGVLARSTAGQSLVAGLQRIQGEVQAELQPYEQFIQTESTALQQGRTTIPADQLQQRGTELNNRVREYQQLVETRDGELRYTQAMQRQAIAQAAEPVVQRLYAERGCGLLLAREATVIHANPAMDITDAVIQAVNQSLPSLTFSRMTPPAATQ